MTKEIILRDFELSDLDAYAMWNKPEAKWQKLDGPYYNSGIDESEKLKLDLKEKIENKLFPTIRTRMAIADSKDNKLIGTVNSYWISKETNWLAIGISIYDPENWGRGIGFQALTKWINYNFEQRPELVRLDLQTWSGNIGMIKLAEKLGFKLEGRFRKARIVNGEYFDSLGFGILREEWKDLSKLVKNSKQRLIR